MTVRKYSDKTVTLSFISTIGVSATDGWRAYVWPTLNANRSLVLPKIIFLPKKSKISEVGGSIYGRLFI